MFFLSLNFILWMVFIVGEKNRAVFFFPGTKYEVYKYFKQKIFFLNNWNWYHYFQVEDLSHQKVQCKLHSCLFVCFFFCFVFQICLRKQPTLEYTTTGFPVKWQLSCVLCRKFASTNQMHYPDLGDKTSSVWNFYSHSSDQCHFIGKSVMDCQERSWWCSHATLLSPLVVHCTLHTHSCADC